MSSDFGIVLIYLVIYEVYFIVCGFCRNVRVVSADFIVYDLFCCLC
jgi:hypothetical protein